MGNISLAILLLLFPMIQIPLQGNRYCYPDGGTNRFQISRRLEFIEDRIIPQTDGEPVPEEALSCKWKISNDYLGDPVIVLTGLDLNTQLNKRRSTRSTKQLQLMRYELNSPASNSNCSSASTRDSKPVELKMLRVLQLSRGSNLRVNFRLTQKSSADTPSLRVRLMEPGFCGREITNFDNNCYTTTSDQRSLSKELAAMKEDSSVMRLASFNSSSALQNFVKESQRTRVGSGLSTRSKEPLNLTQKLRIGIFYQHRTKKIFYLNSAADNFEMAEFEDANMLNFTVPASNSPVSCGSLRAAQQPGGGEDVGLVEFANCSQPLPALISFADAARNRCENYSATVLTWLREVRRSQEHNKEKTESNNAEIARVLSRHAVPIAFILFLVAGCVTISVCFYTNRPRISSDNSAPCVKKAMRSELEGLNSASTILPAAKHNSASSICTNSDCPDCAEEQFRDFICTDAEANNSALCDPPVV